MRILWLSDHPDAGTGYGEQTALMLPLLRDAGHDVAAMVKWGFLGGMSSWRGFPVYPSDNWFGNRDLRLYADDWAADLVIGLCDAFLLEPGLMPDRMAIWAPVDHDPAPPKVLRLFEQSAVRPVAMSRFGERMLADHRPLYVPHSVDTSLFRPLPEGERARLRADAGIGPDTFAAGIVAANKGYPIPRKGFPEAFQAFQAFNRGHPDSILYVHSDAAGGAHDHSSLDLVELQRAVGLPDDAVVYTDVTDYRKGVPRDLLPSVYALFDVLVNASYGEGFGVPVVEAQACGVPVIVTEGSAMSELAGPGWTVPGEPYWDPSQRSFYTLPSVGGFHAALSFAAGLTKGERALLGAAAREFALRYDTREVFAAYWPSILDALAMFNVERELCAA